MSFNLKNGRCIFFYCKRSGYVLVLIIVYKKGDINEYSEDTGNYYTKQG